MAPCAGARGRLVADRVATMTAMQSIEGLDSWLAWAARAGAAHHSSLQSWLRCATAAYRTLNACTEGRDSGKGACIGGGGREEGRSRIREAIDRAL